MEASTRASLSARTKAVVVSKVRIKYLAFRASNRHSLIFNKTVYFVVGEELAVRKLYRIQSSLKIHESLFVLLVNLGNGIRSGEDYHEYK